MHGMESGVCNVSYLLCPDKIEKRERGQRGKGLTTLPPEHKKTVKVTVYLSPNEVELLGGIYSAKCKINAAKLAELKKCK